MKIKHKFKLGQVVEVIGTKNAHRFIIGQAVQITRLLGNDTPYYNCISVGNIEEKVNWLVMEDDLKEILSVTSKRAERKYK